MKATTQLLRTGKLKECPILNWITSYSPFHQYSLNFPLWIPAGGSVFPYQCPHIKIFNLSCLLLGPSEKGTQNNHSITTILNFEPKFIPLAPVIAEFEPNLTPPLFWRRFATTFPLPCASSITNTLSPHCCLPDALNFPPADCEKMTWLPFHCFLFIPLHQANKQD